MNWHEASNEDIAKLLDTTTSGIDSKSIAGRITEYGKNEITDKKKKTVFQILLHQFTDLMILILAAAAIISGFLGELTDTLAILAIIILNGTIGFIQEYKADKAMDALKKMSASNALVIRDGIKKEIPDSELVPGDVIFLEAGNVIPADVRFIETHQLKIDESMLTGESENVEKNTGTLPPANYALGDRLNMGYKGTSVTNGRGSAYVVTTGMKTQLGLIAGMIKTEEKATPLQKRLTAFSKKLSFIILGICVVFSIIELLRGQPAISILLTAISLAVAAIPEALPALVTIALSFGAKRMVKKKALIRKLQAVETLGSVSYICTDKTGTLTLNKMTVKEIYESKDTSFDSMFEEENILLLAMALNNDVIRNKDGLLVGDSTEMALVQYAFDQDYKKSLLIKKYPRIAELPFDSERKCMSTIHETPQGMAVITKGAVDALLLLLEPEQKKLVADFEKRVNAMSLQGYRVLGYALKKIQSLPETINAAEIESSLTFVGFAAMMDPPREEAKVAIQMCIGAGIIPVMITGDHKLTATAIATHLGILTSKNDKVLSGTELDALSDSQFAEQVEKIRVYARVDPAQKLRIVTALQSKNHSVAMTGDGVNDAPALKNADIGIAMGINGTEVSREASDMILLDDNFATVVKAVEDGRRIYDNILKFIKYMMTGNSGELWAILCAPLFGLPIPLLPVQILWVNFITDGLPGLALATEPAEANIMERPPYDPRRSIFAGGMGVHILLVGLLIGASTITVQAWAIDKHLPHWQTMTFTVLCFSQLGNVVAIRSRESLFKIGLLSNKPMLGALIITITLQVIIIYTPFFNSVFKTQALSLSEFAITIGISAVPFTAVEISKLIKRINQKRKTSEARQSIIS